MIKKWISMIIFIVIIGSLGYFVYSEYVASNAPDIVAEDTGVITIEDIKDEEFKEYDQEFNTYKSKYEYSDVFPSWDALNDHSSIKDSQTVYNIEKYPDTTLYLVFASKQKDGKIVTVFSDNPVTVEDKID